MLTVEVDLGDRSYPIYIGAGLIADQTLLPKHIPGGTTSRVLIVTNETVAPLYLDKLQSSLLAYRCDHFILKDGEQYKNLDAVNQIYNYLLENKYDRGCTLIALGGGVVGDVTGFAAATYQRGVGFIQVPTTLLSQVDSSVGGKTGVNHPLGKNMIGAFYQPQCVLADTALLSTLPPREVKAGLAEVIKYGLINDAAFFNWLSENISGLLALEQGLLAQAVKISCEHKAEIVAQDEREGGVRALLNLGHTFGHAIETASGYGVLLHGEAVSVGMVMAADLSMRIGWLSVSQAQRIKAVLVDFSMPVTPPPEITVEQYKSLMLSDKKSRRGNIRFVLMKSLGQSVITDESDLISEELLNKTLQAGENLCQP